MVRTTTLLCFLVSFGVTTTSWATPKQRQVLFRSGEGGYHTYRIPAIIKTTKGTLLAFCEGRESGQDHGHLDIVLRRSIDHGNTWGPMQVVCDNGPYQAGNPCPIVDATTGQILLLYCTSQHSEGEVLKRQGVRDVLITTSDDDGLTWSRPRNISKMTKKENWRWYATGPCSGIQIESGTFQGRLVVPANHSIHYDDGRPWEYRCHSLYSDDQGQTWAIGSSGAPGSNETQIAEVAPDLLIQDIRMQTYRKGLRATRYSRDGGQQWTKLKHDSGRVCPKCQGSVIAVSTPNNKVRRLFSSNPGGGKRTGMTIYESQNGGDTWQQIRCLHKGPSAYSDLVLNAKNQIACLYEAGDKHAYETIVFEVVE